ncbi:MAG TPA: hypothetical protein ENI23_17365 [bacterium]|nr:hypothetical protein [bacterium]
MKFRFEYVSEKQPSGEIEVNSLEDLLELIEREDQDLIIGKSFHKDKGGHKYVIEVYDDYAE